MEKVTRIIVKRLILILLLSVCFLGFTALRAAEGGQLLLDDETQLLVQDWLSLLAKASGLKGQNLRAYLIVSPQVNAGATLGSRILIFTGLILKCQNAAQFLGVLAHEVGHIEGGHAPRFDEANQQAAIPAFATIVLGTAAAVATGNAQALIGGMMGGAHIYQRHLLYFKRTQETVADQIAMRIAQKIKRPDIIQGLRDFLQLLQQGDFSLIPADPYTQTHPSYRERIFALAKVETEVSTPRAEEDKFQRIKAKLAGYLLTPKEVQQIYPLADDSFHAKYARLLSQQKQGLHAQAMLTLAKMLQEHPNDPYLLELQGHLWREQQKIKSAMTAYRAALKLQPAALVLKLQLAQLLTESHRTADLKEAIIILRSLATKQQEGLNVWRPLATAYGKVEQLPMAAWALAEEAYNNNDLRLAKAQAKRAKKLGIQDSFAQRRLNDILAQE